MSLAHPEGASLASLAAPRREHVSISRISLLAGRREEMLTPSEIDDKLD